MVNDFVNARYEYTTRECASDAIEPPFEAQMAQEGWRRCWADITMEGMFVVYRRDRADFERPTARESV